MAPSVSLCLCLCLFFNAARSVDLDDRQRPALVKRPPQVKLEPLWSPDRGRPLSEMLDLDVDRHRRLARGAEEDEQQSTFSQSFENDSVTPPQATELSNITGTGNDHHHHGNASRPDGDAPRLFNPFYPLVDGSYAAYAVLFLAGLVLAVGVVGNMAVMCVVWNNYYMRSAWNYLLASMAFWDFLVLVLCLPVVVLNQLSHRRILGDITCRMVPYMEVVSLGVTSFTLCALGIDRFHAATSSSQPKARRVERCRSVLLKLLLVWLAALLLSSPEVFLWQLSQAVSPSTGRLVDSCTITPSSPLTLYLPDSLHSLLLRYHQGRMWWCFGCYFCLPVLFTILCQMATRNVNSDSSSTQKQRNHDDRSSNQKRQQHQAVERQLNCTLLALAVVYGVCALPEHVCNITLAYTHITVSEETAAMLALLHHFLLFFKSAVTPVLLLCLCKALGQAFMDCCCCCCQECQPATAQGSPGSAKLKAANETSIFFDKAKDTSAILSISS
ncbi:G-protein coupled receptor 37-like 1 [Sphaeramia orbicularis]|uniref:G-protein coupled receptors family 1 profile domain-containing protein n=1 Tax=Sphaeramia orbicularis TaxID=375764 RepID=A0A672ZZR9_9TELE|nr:G-protein coupled receptor 37-like 1 [Sphaeramia orbicularis]XP_029994321.1 G-protein coupled receptor 37-like 1 [Sphaeramia orbicularis]XP_029994322.1 G-protein coupled receptor 37-like 1 [Sphaeramia orbicularis]XP_029994323.1 G-protein coupled receptor 37-like 1 [Sphaeramia orbicularis]